MKFALTSLLIGLTAAFAQEDMVPVAAVVEEASADEQEHRMLPNYQYPSYPAKPKCDPSPYCHGYNCCNPGPNCYEVCYEVSGGGKGGKKGGFYYGGGGGAGYYGGKGGKKGGYYYGYEECEVVCDNEPACDPNPTCGASYMSNNCCYSPQPWPRPPAPRPPMPGPNCYEVCTGGSGGKGGKKGGYYGGGGGAGYYGGKGGKKGGYYMYEECEIVCDEPACDPNPTCGASYMSNNCCYPPMPPKYPTPMPNPNCYEVCTGGSGGKGGKKGGFYYGGGSGYYGGKGGKKGGFYYGYEECEIVCDGGCDPNPTCGGSYMSNNCCNPPRPWPMPTPMPPAPTPPGCYEECYAVGGGKGGKKGGFGGYYGGKGGKKGGFYYGYEECEIICPPSCDPSPYCYGYNCCKPSKPSKYPVYY